MELGQVGVAEPELGESAGVVGFDEDVGSSSESSEPVAIVAVGQVHNDAAFSEPDAGPVEGCLTVLVAALCEGGAPSCLGAAGWLDLDHLRPEIGEEATGHLRAHCGCVDHPDAGQGSEGHCADPMTCEGLDCREKETRHAVDADHLSRGGFRVPVLHQPGRAARVRLSIPAPATIGNDEFERYFRVQANTLEQIIAFLPAAFAFAWFISDVWAAGLGVVWVVGRMLYFLGYVGGDPARRAPGMIMTFGATIVLILGALFGSVRAVL